MSLFALSGRFEGINVYETRLMPCGAGIALPGLGIVVTTGTNSTCRNIPLLRHEFGHILQARQTGLIIFYIRIGIPSLFSAWRNGKNGHRHRLFWTEVWADQLADNYFKIDQQRESDLGFARTPASSV